jgi:putative salt-induced outer membrane protein YdiY
MLDAWQLFGQVVRSNSAAGGMMRKSFLIFGLTAVMFVAAANGLADDNAQAWHGEVAFGLSLAKGNSDTFLMNASALAHREWPQNELKLGADGNYGLNNFGRSNETQSANNIHGFVDYKRLFTERFYGNLRIDGFHDDVAEVRYRVIVGPAAGYYFIKSELSRLSGEVGPSFIEERLNGLNDHGYLTLRVTERGEHSFNKAGKVWEQVDFLPQIDDFNHYLLNLELGAEAALNTRLSLRVVAADKYNSDPAPERKNNDISLVSALVYKY